MIGTGIETAEVLLFEGGFDELPEILHADGDMLALESELSNLQQYLKVIKLPNLSMMEL
ncbi:unnamed protein product [Musa textilis]